ncbi:hypothetical protein GCM10027169_24610 [Gordonia jinhuaensis]|uniref:Uncharacterized protein n=1 Tax=Gordonia jinhuaensis TaxID=1517702 RepID=A0A916TCE9_9ACTN|nr:hypothetical protein [Gordonia jinhuaensis]GGB39965.1 hypothetical protein GCM10011489_29490 [Gordonia jinhuaensis]
MSARNSSVVMLVDSVTDCGKCRARTEPTESTADEREAKIDRNDDVHRQSGQRRASRHGKHETEECQSGVDAGVELQRLRVIDGGHPVGIEFFDHITDSGEHRGHNEVPHEQWRRPRRHARHGNEEDPRHTGFGQIRQHQNTPRIEPAKQSREHRRNEGQSFLPRPYDREPDKWKHTHRDETIRAPVDDPAAEDGKQ